MPTQGGHRRDPRRPRPAFTLLELVIVIGVIAMLTGLLLPAMSACRAAGRNVKCIAQMRIVANNFRIFADDFAAENRGDSAAFGPNRFEIEDFQEQQYRIAEYWDLPSIWQPSPYDADAELMICPEGPTQLERRPRVPCRFGAVRPFENVSLAVNMRFFRGGQLEPVVLSGRVLDHPAAPLLIDVDGEAAARREQLPYYTAPSVSPTDVYASGDYWFPSDRHRGRLNVAFVGGHVESSPRPLAEPGWEWGYQPEN